MPIAASTSWMPFVRGSAPAVVDSGRTLSAGRQHAQRNALERAVRVRSGTVRVRRRPMAHRKPLAADHGTTSPLARRRTPLQWIGLVHARR
jgi:hypothetical protein